MSKSLSLIIPVYNETTRLARGLSIVEKYQRHLPNSWELILVDDGSDIPVHTQVKRDSALPIKIFRLPRNMGKGRAIKEAVLRSQGTYILFCDIDFSVEPVFIGDILKALKTRDIAIASRRLTGSAIRVHQPLAREISGRIFTYLSNALCQTQVADATCGLKGYRRAVALNLFGASKINRWVFDTEILFLARRWGYSIAEVPVQWSHHEGTRVRTRDMVQSLIDLVKIRWFWAKGDYVRRMR